jgi:hypothetical protein
LGLIASTRQLLSFVINVSKHFISCQSMIRECAYSFNELIDACFTSFVALAGVVPTRHSTAKTIKHRLRAIRLTGSLPRVDGIGDVKYRA